LVDAAFEWQDADYTETLTLCTKLCEDEIVHGGERELAQTILEAGDSGVPVMFVLTSCGPEIVGDDIAAVCEDLRPEVRFELVPVQSAGFKGDQNLGTDLALEAILTHLVPDDGPHTGRHRGGDDAGRSVVLIAPQANANPTWMGDLAWAKEVLAELGATVVATLSHDTSLEELQRIPHAAACILLSHDAGQGAADLLADRYGIEQWCQGLPLPLGFTNTRNWVLELGRRLDAEALARAFIARGESMVVKVCRRRGLAQSAMHRAPTAVVADATVGVPLVRFISEDLEMIPELVCLRSGLPGVASLLQRELQSLQLAPHVLHKTDVYQTKMALAETKPEMVLGSVVERHAVEELGIPYVFRVVNPIRRYRMTDRAYWGYTGMLNLIEIIQNDWWDRYRSKKRRYKARW
jgi:nitrogenase molybdenum-iron protein alpha/beta subunit